MRESFRIEISRPRPDEWRVVERSHHAAESVFRVQFNTAELTELLAEIHVCLLDANASAEAQISRLRRLGGRLAEMTLPQVFREKISTHAGVAEFFLDDASVMLPVELYPNGNGFLGEAMPVSRHWLCEGSRTAPKHATPDKDCQALIVADPAENLPAAQQEGKALFRKLRSQKGWKCRYFGRAMTAAGLSRELPNTDVLHLAAHYVAGDNQVSPGVMMADGPWLPGEAFSTPEMVFTNCCHAGLPIGDNGSLSLAGHFLKHGSRHVIAPFLPVCDRTAGEFAQEFYQAFLADKDAAQAVWSAKRAVGPASWMYWHFGPVSEESIRETPPAKKKRRSRIWVILFLLALIIAIPAVAPWMKPVDRIPAPNPATIATINDVASAPLPAKEKSTGVAVEPTLPIPNPAETEPERNAPGFPAADSREKTAPPESSIGPAAPEPATIHDEKNNIAIPDGDSSATGISIPEMPKPEKESGKVEGVSEAQAKAPVALEYMVATSAPEIKIPVAKPAIIPESSETSTAVPAEAASLGDADSKGPDAVAHTAPTLEPSKALAVISPETHSTADSEEPVTRHVAVVPQTLAVPVQPSVAPEKPGLFGEALFKIERKQSFEEAAIQVLDGYPEKYLKTALKGKPDYNAATGKASVIVEVTINNAEYRAMAVRLSEMLKKYGHDGERISATMERPYDSYMEVRFQFSGRKKFSDLLLLCIRANDALTQSEWAFHPLPRSSIDAILSSMGIPLLSVELTDGSGQTIASTSQKVPEPFMATDERCFSILPAFNSEGSKMPATSVMPGRNRLEIKMEFDLSLEELKQITDAVCTVKKGARLPDEFTYRFLK